MGKQVQCNCRWDQRTSTGKALLETDEILFRGDFRLVVRLKDIKSVKAVDGELRIDSPQGKIVLTLGAEASKWADKILHPPTRLDKLGLKPGFRVSVVGIHDAEFSKELAAAKADVTQEPAPQSDLLFLGAQIRAELKKLSAMKKAIKPAGAVWVVYPKGIKAITQADVMAAGHDAGLVDMKVARFSEILTALKFVIPVAERG